MKTIKVDVRHAGARAVVIPVYGGTLTVKPGDAVGPVDILPLSEEREKLYASKGVTIKARGSAGKKASTAVPPSVDVVALQKAYDDAKAAYERAYEAATKDEATDEDERALQAAIAAMDDAEEKLEKAKQ